MLPSQLKRKLGMGRVLMKKRKGESTGFTSFRAGRSFKGKLKQFNKAVIKSKETGFVDLAVSTYACDTTGTITLLATIAQGATVNDRIGKKVMLKSLQARGEFVAGSAFGISHNALIIVYDIRPRGALPGITDILNTATSRSFNDDTNSGRFKILKRIDNITIGDNDVNPTSTPTAILADFFLDLKDLPTVYMAAGTGAINDIEQGAIYAITVGNIAAGLTAGQLNIGYRTRFWDA